MPLLLADDLFKFYHPGDTEVRALRGASVSVDRGEIVVLVGPSGSGKSTLLACIAGLDDPDGGMVTIDGERMTRRPETERAALRARYIGFLAQSGNLFSDLNVADNIALQMQLRGMAIDRDRIAGLLHQVGLEHRAEARPPTLSGGEAARAGLAVALAGDPPLLIADEPTSEIDRETEGGILDALEERRANGGATLIATHSPTVEARASRVAAIEDGRILLSSPLRDTAPAEQGPKARDPTRSGLGTSVQGEPLIEADHLTCVFVSAEQRVVVLGDVSCRLHAGARIALIGPSGSGKSTLLNALAGLEEPYSGAVAWPGLDSSRPLRPAQIGFVFQSPSLVPALTVMENLRLPLEIADRDLQHCMSPDEALGRLSLLDLRDKLPDQLSEGQMQRVALARALVTRPKIIFADEPTGQLDRATGRFVIDALLTAIEGSDTALLVATHDPLIAGILTEVWRMDAGALTTEPARKAVA